MTRYRFGYIVTLRRTKKDYHGTETRRRGSADTQSDAREIAKRAKNAKSAKKKN